MTPRRTRWLLACLFGALLVLFAAGLWGTLLRPPPYEVRGWFVARPAGNLILVRHDPLPLLGMGAMELMAVFAEPGQLDGVGLVPGDPVRLSVRQVDDRLVLLSIEKTP
jgi:hypothetical protein